MYVQIVYATSPNAEAFYCASATPFTEYYTHATPRLVDYTYYSIEALLDGLRATFGVPDLMLPDRDYFIPTDCEREISEDPIIRVVTF